MTELDLDAIRTEFLTVCGSCDAGQPTGCTCTSKDFRPAMLALLREVETLRENWDRDRRYADMTDAMNHRLAEQLKEARQQARIPTFHGDYPYPVPTITNAPDVGNTVTLTSRLLFDNDVPREGTVVAVHSDGRLVVEFPQPPFPPMRVTSKSEDFALVRTKPAGGAA